MDNSPIPRRLRKWVRPLDIVGHQDARALLFAKPHEEATGETQQLAILAHGGGNDRVFGLGYAIEALMQAGFGVLTAHMAGHGQGGTDHFSVEGMRSRLDALVDQARALARGGPVVILGQSMGGAFALDQALRGCAGDKVVAVSAPVSLDHQMRLGLELGCLLRPAVYRMLRYAGPYAALPAYRGFKRALFPVRVPEGVHYLTAFSRALEELDLVLRLAEAGQGLPSILVVHGAQDGVVPVEQARLLAGASGHAELFVARGVHHLDPLVNRNVVRTLLDWLV